MTILQIRSLIATLICNRNPTHPTPFPLKTIPNIFPITACPIPNTCSNQMVSQPPAYPLFHCYRSHDVVITLTNNHQNRITPIVLMHNWEILLTALRIFASLARLLRMSSPRATIARCWSPWWPHRRQGHQRLLAIEATIKQRNCILSSYGDMTLRKKKEWITERQNTRNQTKSPGPFFAPLKLLPPR